MPNYYSQHAEDFWITHNLKLPDQGVFVEVGAHDGKNLSNTLHFEEKGWTGLCIEADPRMWHHLLQNRKCQKFFGAVGSDPNLLFDMNPESTWSGFGRGGQSIKVPVLPLSSVLAAYGRWHIDLLSIDVEGAELDVWESGRFSINWTFPQIVIIEHDTHGLPNAEAKICDVFNGLPYFLRHRTEGNLIFERV